jgi:uncharacterized membrane protein
MPHSSLLYLAVIALIALVMRSFWREILWLIVSLLIAVLLLGLHQVLLFLHH